MPLTEEGNYIDAEHGFMCNGCHCWYYNDQEQLFNSMAYCIECNKENHDN